MNIVSVFNQFPTQESCVKHIEKIKWDNSPICPYCGSTHCSAMKKEKGYGINRYHCNKCNATFSVLVGTIFQDTKLELQKWFLAISLISNAKKGISSRQLARDLEVNRNTAWSMQMRIRKAMYQGGAELLKGIIEMDETYIGGKPRKGTGIHKRGRGTDKTPVVGMVERDGRVKAKVQQKTKLKGKDLKRLVCQHIDREISPRMTDDYKGYSRMFEIIKHKSVNHSLRQYSDCKGTHTNTIEGFWALLKRGIMGQYHSLSDRHLKRYIDEFCFKYNNRKNPLMFDLILENGIRR
jgi:transposase-like protein